MVVNLDNNDACETGMQLTYGQISLVLDIEDILVIAWVLVREQVYWTNPPNENSLTEYCTQCHGHSHSDNEVLVLRPEVTMQLHKDSCTLTLSNVTVNWWL